MYTLKDAHDRRCKGKYAYWTKRKAILAARILSLKNNCWMVPYQCFDCGYWHIGHAWENELIQLGPFDRNLLLPKVPKKQPEFCKFCGQPIPLETVKKANESGGDVALYCSRECKLTAKQQRTMQRQKDKNEHGTGRTIS